MVTATLSFPFLIFASFISGEERPRRSMWACDLLRIPDRSKRTYWNHETNHLSINRSQPHSTLGSVKGAESVVGEKPGADDMRKHANNRNRGPVRN